MSQYTADLAMKAQVTLEFIVATAIVSMIFLITVNFVVRERKLMSQSLWAVDGQDRAEEIANAINSVYLAGDGSSMNLTLPSRLVGGVNYTVTVYRRLVSVQAPAYGREFEWKFATGDVHGAALGLGVTPGTVEVTNVNGTVHLSSH